MATLAKVPALLLDSSHRSDALAKQEGGLGGLYRNTS